MFLFLYEQRYDIGENIDYILWKYDVYHQRCVVGHNNYVAINKLITNRYDANDIVMLLTTMQLNYRSWHV